jgi:hypothetical protein
VTATQRQLRLKPQGLSHQGFVTFDEQTFPCQVTNMSTTGATLTFALLIPIPDRFMLQLTPDGHVVRACTVTWDEGNRIGVTFDPH